MRSPKPHLKIPELLLLLCGMAFLAMWPGEAHATKVKGRSAVIPTPMSGQVSAYRNSPIVIRLTAKAGTTAQLKFIIRSAPKAGKLSEFRPVPGENNQVDVTYTPDPRSTADSDRFLFTAEVTGGQPSTAAAIDIKLITPVAQLEVLRPIQFRNVEVGTVGKATFSVRNNGQARFETELELLSPFSADRRILEVAPGAVEHVEVEFRPLVAGKIGTHLQLQAGEPKSIVGIFAEAVAPFKVSGDLLEISSPVLEGMRQAKLRLKNETDQPLVIAINAQIDPVTPSVHVKFPPKVELEPLSESEIVFKVPAGILEGLEEVFTLSTATYTKEVRVVVSPTPAELVIEDHIPGSSHDFGTTTVGSELAPKSFVVANKGGSPLVATVRVSPPFALSGAGENLELGSGQKVVLNIEPDTSVVGLHRGEVAFEWAQGRVGIPLSMKVDFPEVVADPESPSKVGETVEDPEGKKPATSGTRVSTTPEPREIETYEGPFQSYDYESESKTETLYKAIEAIKGIELTNEPFYAAVPRATNLKFVAGDHRSIDVSFTPAKGGVKDYMFEMAQWYQHPRTGQFLKRWVYWPGETKKLGYDNGDIIVRLEPMMQGTEYHLRVVARDENDRRALPSEPYIVTTGRYVSPWKKILPWMKWVILVLGILLVRKLYVTQRDEKEQKGSLHAGEAGGIRGLWQGLRGAIFR